MKIKAACSLLIVIVIFSLSCSSSHSIPSTDTMETEVSSSQVNHDAPPPDTESEHFPPPPPDRDKPSDPDNHPPEFKNKPLELDRPLPTGPSGEIHTVYLGEVVLETFAPVTITTIEQSTNIYIYARNEGDTVFTVQGPLARDIDVPFWIQHFFEMNPYPQEIMPGETVTFSFLIAEGPNEGGSYTLSLPFEIEETGQNASVDIAVKCETGPMLFQSLPITATIEGSVRAPDGTPVIGADISVHTYNSREQWRTVTDTEGNYVITVPSGEDIAAALGDRPLPYRSLGYNVIVTPEGYATGFQGEIDIQRGETVQLDFSLEPVMPRDYTQTGEYVSDGVYGYWWVLPDPAFTGVFGVQGRHPPELHEEGHIVKADTSGNELWRYPTTSECWGFDVSTDGDVAAGCHTGEVYLLDDEGNLQWELDTGQMNRWVRFSPDGESLLTGPVEGSDVAVLDTATGATMWKYQEMLDWLRNAVWSPDGQRVVTGHSGGIIAMFTRNGEFLWRQAIGEFPMLLEMDSDYNTYLAGKNRELISFDEQGNLRWRYRIANHVVTAGWNNMAEDSGMIVLGTVGGMVQAYSTEGQLLWQRNIPGSLQGHNALDITPDGRYIVVGSAGDPDNAGYVTLFDRNGTVLWETRSPDRRDGNDYPYSYEYDHNHRGTITVSISDDGNTIAAGYGDSTIRIFELIP